MSINPAIIDCRNFDDFCSGHRKFSCSIPANEFFHRMHELPKTNQPLIVYDNKETLEKTCYFLQEKGFSIVEKNMWTAKTVEQLAADNLLAFGSFSQQLWSPAPIIIDFQTRILPSLQINPCKGLDIACGSGRDMVYLAMNGWQMTGIDYLTEALQRANHLAKTNNVCISTYNINLEQTNVPILTSNDSCLTPNSFDLICVLRYLHRPLFPTLKNLLKPNGIILYQTFLEGCEKFGSPKNPNFLLRHDELKTIFHDFKIIQNSITYLDDGRPMSSFIGQSPSSR